MTVVQQELFGIVKLADGNMLAGRFMDVELFGVGMCRLDIPSLKGFDGGFGTQFFAGAEVKGLTITDRAAVELANGFQPPADKSHLEPSGDKPGAREIKQCSCSSTTGKHSIGCPLASEVPDG